MATEVKSFEALAGKRGSMCSDSKVCVKIKNTFISVAQSSADSARSCFRRVKTFPLSCEESAEQAREESTEVEESSAQAEKVSQADSGDSNSDLDADATSAGLITPWAYPDEGLQEYFPSNDISLTSSPGKVLSFSLPCNAPPHIWQNLYAPRSTKALEETLPAAAMPKSKQHTSVRSGQVQEQHHLTCKHNHGKFQVMWHIDKRQLSYVDKQIASPSFFISLGEELPEASCKLVLHAQGASFLKARGHAHLSIKCDTILPETAFPVSVRFIVGTGRKEQPARGPVIHNFAEGATCGLPEDEEDWDMRSSVYKSTRTVAVRVEITPMRV